MRPREQFWKTIPLELLTDEEWELLCDRCGRCCLIKLEDETSGEVVYTSVVCSLLDLDQCRCSDYPNRHQRVPDCVHLTPTRIRVFDWLPASCAYRRVERALPLQAWHPLISGDSEGVHLAGVSVRSYAINAQGDEPLEEMVICFD
jgi:hypothetical protein